MTIDEAINELMQCYSFNSKTAEKKNEAISMAIKALEKQRWILTTERLPNKFEDVWIVDKYGRVTICRLGYTGWRNAKSDELIYHIDDVIAWIPYNLPEPYQGKR